MPLAMAKRPVMEQVEVDDPHVQEQLGKIQVSSFATISDRLLEQNLRWRYKNSLSKCSALSISATLASICHIY